MPIFRQLNLLGFAPLNPAWNSATLEQEGIRPDSSHFDHAPAREAAAPN